LLTIASTWKIHHCADVFFKFATIYAENMYFSLLTSEEAIHDISQHLQSLCICAFSLSGILCGIITHL